ncbi:ethylene-responsive transcription factor ERF017-like [Olea europaea var. sylvestris]|uniref:ethylene-responsive transcription factor ERF017-like n=1 Tax=Olea europaea var. sylvestris TaxID=158386 RepID=UPI000C1D503C|nr:ethylene-responsive transcription factor ERF017-like [Olea europaea var. sylvestris]
MVKTVPQKQQQPSNHSSAKYKGVRKRKWGKFVSEIRLPNSRERIWLGSYDTAEKAARAFDAALFCLRGKNVKFNFPDNPPEILNGRSMTPVQIQAAAARFAHSDSGNLNPSSPSSSSSISSSELLESLSPSVSDEAAQLDREIIEIPTDDAFMDQLLTMGNENSVLDFGNFPAFDDITSDFLTAPLPDYWPGNTDNIPQDSFLWNF